MKITFKISTKTLLLFLVLNTNSGVAQTKSEIEFLLTEIGEVENSKEIKEAIPAKKVISYGKDILPLLGEFIIDTSITKTWSDCNERYLTKGEIAIIIADQITFLPYAKLTNVQNCTFVICEDNPNLIEYYLWKIAQDGYLNFQQKYLNWLSEIKKKGKKSKKN